MMTNVTWAARGTVIDAPWGDQLTSYYVLSRCSAAIIGYYCEPCQQPLANVGQLVMHLEDYPADTGVEHHIAVWCPEHRVYETPDDTQMRKLTGQEAA